MGLSVSQKFGWYSRSSRNFEITGMVIKILKAFTLLGTIYCTCYLLRAWQRYAYLYIHEFMY